MPGSIDPTTLFDALWWSANRDKGQTLQPATIMEGTRAFGEETGQGSVADYWSQLMEALQRPNEHFAASTAYN